MCRAVIQRGRTERWRCRWIERGLFELDVFQPGRFDFVVSRRAEPLLETSEHESLFGRRQPLAFPAPTEMLQTRLHHYYPPAWLRATRSLKENRLNRVSVLLT